MSKGRSIELFFVDGTPDDMVTAAIPFQWSGHVLITRRTQLKAALIRDEAARPGVYLLVGEKEGQSTLYVGETDELKARLVNHASTKDWWDTAILISSNGEPLNKAHVRYLEYRIFTDAKRINKITMDFGQEPTEKPLNEAARAHMDVFIENLYLVLPALRFDFLTEQIKAESPISATPQKTDVTYFTLQVPKHGGTARARLEKGNFIIEAGSKARKEWSSSRRTSNRDLFNDLVEQGVLVPEGDHNTFAKSYVFPAQVPLRLLLLVTMLPGLRAGCWKARKTRAMANGKQNNWSQQRKNPNDYCPDCLQGLEFLYDTPRRRRRLRRLSGTVDLPHLPEDGGRICKASVQSRCCNFRRI